MSRYAQGVTYTVADIWSAFEAGAKEARTNGGAPSDALISGAADAYCKMVHPLASQPRTEPDVATGAVQGERERQFWQAIKRAYVHGYEACSRLAAAGHGPVALETLLLSDRVRRYLSAPPLATQDAAAALRAPSTIAPADVDAYWRRVAGAAQGSIRHHIEGDAERVRYDIAVVDAALRARSTGTAGQDLQRRLDLTRELVVLAQARCDQAGVENDDVYDALRRVVFVIDGGGPKPGVRNDVAPGTAEPGECEGCDGSGWIEDHRGRTLCECHFCNPEGKKIRPGAEPESEEPRGDLSNEWIVTHPNGPFGGRTTRHRHVSEGQAKKWRTFGYRVERAEPPGETP